MTVWSPNKILDDPDKFGYYLVGDFKTYSKVEAIEVSKKSNISPIWHYNDEIFDQQDWTNEPDVDLWELYKLRAQQIRSNYDYVVLWYSGGSDSHNMLSAWIEAGCKIDEIASTWNYEADADRQSFCNAEINNVVLPDIEKLKNQGLDFKFRLVDISNYCIDIVKTFGLNFEYYVNYHGSVNNPAKALIREKVDDYKDLIASGKRLCFVWGLEKPRVSFDQNGYYYAFIDTVDNCISPYVQENCREGWYDELFYISPNFPLLPIKSAHVIKNFLDQCDNKEYFDSVLPVHAHSKKFNRSLKIEMVKTVLYPKWNNNIFCNGKASSMLFSVRDEWFLNSNLNEIKMYNGMIKELVKILGKDWIHFRTKNIKFQESKRYYLEK